MRMKGSSNSSQPFSPTEPLLLDQPERQNKDKDKIEEEEEVENEDQATNEIMQTAFHRRVIANPSTSSPSALHKKREHHKNKRKQHQQQRPTKGMQVAAKSKRKSKNGSGSRSGGSGGHRYCVHHHSQHQQQQPAVGSEEEGAEVDENEEDDEEWIDNEGEEEEEEEEEEREETGGSEEEDGRPGASMLGGEGERTGEEIVPLGLSSKVGQLQRAISDLSRFLEEQDMDWHFSSLLKQLDKISLDVTVRLEEVTVYHAFLHTHNVSTKINSSGYFSLLPDELLLKVLSFLNERELSVVTLVNRQWKRLSEDESLWRRLYFLRWRDTMVNRRRTTTPPFSLYATNASDEMITEEKVEEANKADDEEAEAREGQETNTTMTFSRVAPCNRNGITSSLSSSTIPLTRPKEENEPEEESETKRFGTVLSSSASSILRRSNNNNLYHNQNYGTTHTATNKKRSMMNTDWKANYIRRRNMERNWREGKYRVKTYPGHTSNARVRCLQFDEEKLVMGSFDQKCIQVLDFYSRKPLTELHGHTGGVMSLKFQDDILLSASRDKTVKMWDLTTGACARTFTEHVASVWCLDWDGGSVAVSGSEDRLVKMWDLRSGRCIHTFTGHAKGIGSITFDDNFVASGSRDKSIRIWDCRMRRCLHTLKGHANSVRCLRFDDQRVVSGSWDNTIKIWSLLSGDLMGNLQGHTDRVLTLQFDEDKIVSGSFDKTIKVWDLATHQCLLTLEGHGHPLAHVQFDETKIFSGSRDLTIKVWDFEQGRSTK
ncbi:SCF ubiquitin ligase complex subunit cdc4 [Balamuthia mandrillaris]